MRLTRRCLDLSTVLLLSLAPGACVIVAGDGDDTTGESSADGDSSTDADGGSGDTSTGSSTSGDGDGDSSTGDGDAGDGDAGDGDSSTGDGDAGDGDSTTGDGDAGDGDTSAGDGDAGDGDSTTGDGDTSGGDGDGDGDGDNACADLTGVDFGLCDAILGWGVFGENCESVSGCEVTAEYEAAVYDTLEACQMACPIACGELSGVDFGACDAVLGWGVSGGACTEISGCDVPASYESQVYETLQACVGACGSDGCTDLAGEDFGACAAVLGYGVINGSCVAISGCSLPTAFEGDVYQTMDACLAACD